MKPSDSRCRVLARVRKHRRKKRRKALTARRETERIEQQRRSLDLWEMITGERLESLSKATQLAVQPMRLIRIGLGGKPVSDFPRTLEAIRKAYGPVLELASRGLTVLRSNLSVSTLMTARATWRKC
jgi:hypothetical protein